MSALDRLDYLEALGEQSARAYADSHDDDPAVEAEFAPLSIASANVDERSAALWDSIEADTEASWRHEALR